MAEPPLLARKPVFVFRSLGGMALIAVAVLSLGRFFAPRDAGAASPTTRSTARPSPPKRAILADGGAVASPLVPAAAAPLRTGPSAPLGVGALPDAGVVEARTLEGGTRSFKFSELDIEGRLKSPQIVYFLRRVRAEFEAEPLGHRSFMREMSETRKESGF